MNRLENTISPVARARIFWIALAAVALSGAVLHWRATTLGAGISPDSTVYISLARGFLIPFGFQFPLQGGGDFPPFYPALLAFGGALVGDPAAAARPINTILFGCNIFLVGWIVKRILPGAFVTPLFAAALMATSVPILYVHTMAWSEPTFIFAALSGILLLTNYLEHGQWWHLVLASLAFGVTALDRYVGIALAGMGIFTLLVFGPGSLRRKIGSAILFTLIAWLPLAAWMTQRPTRRLWNPQLPPLQYFLDGYYNVSIWIVPESSGGLSRYRDLIVWGVMFFLVLGLGYVWWRMRHIPLRVLLSRVPPLWYVVVLFGLAYAAVNILARMFLGPALELHVRALSPLFAVGVILFVTVTWFIVSQLDTRFARLVAAALMLVVLWTGFGEAWRYVRRIGAEGLGYASKTWQTSPLMARVRELDPDLVYYSNGSDAIYFLTGRKVVRLPNLVDKMNMRDNQLFRAEMQSVSTQISSGNAVIVWFNNYPDRWYQPDEQTLNAVLELRQIAREADGAIFR